MTGAGRRALLLVIVAAIPVVAAAQLNPMVKVLPRPKSAVPAECDQGLAIQPAQRLTPEERTSVRDTSRDMQAPASASLRGEAQTAFEAAQSNSRDMFRDALVRAKSMLTSYPPGGERTAATSLVDALDDIGKIWDYEFSSPTGAFFDTTSEPFRIASKYPGYESSIRRQIITDQNGNRFYPTHETRDFLVAEAAQRLSRLTGKPVPASPPTRGTARVTRPEPRVTAATTTPSAKTPKAEARVPKRATTQTTKHTRRRTSHRAAHKPATHEARAKTATMHTAPPPRSTPRVQTPPPPAISSPKPVTEPVAAGGGSEPSTTSSASSAPPSTTSSAAIASSDTATTTAPSTMSAAAPAETTDTTTTESNASEKSTKSRSLLWPILLIIVGVGLLLTLWRASS